jgi:hypothetical protein
MPLVDINKNAISFKKLSGKAHTQFGFASTEESISSNLQIAYTTIFGETVNPLPLTNGGLSALYSTDGIIEKIRFEIDLIPDTEIGINQSQGYRLKLPSNYSSNGGALSAIFANSTYLYEALGKLQIVPSLYGTLKNDGTTEYDPVLLQTNGTTVITKFDSINWNLDPYSGVLFVQDPPAGYNVSALRPAFIEAYLFVGDYLDVALGSSGALSAGQGISPQDITGNTITVDLENYIAPSNINITFSGTSSFIIEDDTTNKFGLRYAANYAPTFQPRSLVDKAYVDSVASGLSVRQAVQVATIIPIDLTNGSSDTTIDGYNLNHDDRVLVKNQTNKNDNGIYVYSTGTTTFSRSLDFDVNGEIVSGAFTSVVSGATNNATLWVVITPDPIDVGSTAIEWVALSLPITYIGGIGIDINGTTIDVDGASLAGLGIGWNISNQRFDLDFTISHVGSGLGKIFKEFDAFRNPRFRSIIGSGTTSVTTSGDNIVIFSNGLRNTFITTILSVATIPDNAIDSHYISSGSTGYTLQTNPQTGCKITITDGLGNANINNIEIIGNGKNINGDNTAFINTDYGSITFEYNGINWNVTSYSP